MDDSVPVQAKFSRNIGLGGPPRADTILLVIGAPPVGTDVKQVRFQ
jgi:hypothetical protein